MKRKKEEDEGAAAVEDSYNSRLNKRKSSGN